MQKTPPIHLLILFGSQATKKTSALSDTDIAILSDHSLSFEEKSNIMESVARDFDFSEDKIDLIDIMNAPPLLQMQIATQGKLLRGDPELFLRFRVLAWKRYQNTARFRRMREKHLEKVFG